MLLDRAIALLNLPTSSLLFSFCNFVLNFDEIVKVYLLYEKNNIFANIKFIYFIPNYSQQKSRYMFNKKVSARLFVAKLFIIAAY